MQYYKHAGTLTYIYKIIFVSMRFILIITQDTIAANCQDLMRCMDLGSVVGHERVSRFCFSVSCLFFEYWYYFYLAMWSVAYCI
jgi:hypothetical protein